jgi:hypothetical protein
VALDREARALPQRSGRRAEGVLDDAERDRGLELDRGAAHHAVARGGGASAQRVQERRLADPRLAAHHEDVGRSRPEGVDEGRQAAQLHVAADELGCGHRRCLRAPRSIRQARGTWFPTIAGRGRRRVRS